MIALFHVTGAYIYVDPDGNTVGVEDVFTKLEAARKHYEPVWGPVQTTSSASSVDPSDGRSTGSRIAA